MTVVLSDMRPVFVEDMVRTTPDRFNGNRATGDEVATDPDNGDWSEPLQRALSRHLGLDPSLPANRNQAPIVYIGKTRLTYNMKKTIHLWGSLVGIFPKGPKLRWNVNGQHGIIAHFPPIGANDGTFNATSGFLDSIPSDLQAFENYAAENILVKDITIEGNQQEGNIGFIQHTRLRMEGVTIRNWGWHGLYKTAGVLRPNSSNANLSFYYFCEISNCGQFPGTDPNIVDADFNPTGWRGYGSCFRAQGPDSNSSVFVGCNFQLGYYSGIRDNSFLGNDYVSIHTQAVGRQYTQQEKTIYDAAVAWLAANPAGGALQTSDPDTWNAKTGLAAEARDATRAPVGVDVGDTFGWDWCFDSDTGQVYTTGMYSELISPPAYSRIGNKTILSRRFDSASGVEGTGHVQDTDKWEMAGYRFVNRLRDDNDRPGPGLFWGDIKGALWGWYSGESADFSVRHRWIYQSHVGGDPSNTGAEGVGFFNWVFNATFTTMRVAFSSNARAAARVIQRGAIVLSTVFYLSRWRFNVTLTNPSTVIPSTTGSLHNALGSEGDRDGDIAIYIPATYSDGDSVLYMCRGTVGTDAQWVPMTDLTVPSLSTLPPLSAPTNTAAPTISGDTQEGSTLTGSAGTWTGNPTPTLTYQWLRNSLPISGATSLASYTTTASDVGSAISLRETGTNAVGSANQTSNSLGPITALGAGTGLIGSYTWAYGWASDGGSPPSGNLGAATEATLQTALPVSVGTYAGSQATGTFTSGDIGATRVNAGISGDAQFIPSDSSSFDLSGDVYARYIGVVSDNAATQGLLRFGSALAGSDSVELRADWPNNRWLGRYTVNGTAFLTAISGISAGPVLVDIGLRQVGADTFRFLGVNGTWVEQSNGASTLTGITGSRVRVHDFGVGTVSGTLIFAGARAATWLETNHTADYNGSGISP